jgi:hypothetical protein
VIFTGFDDADGAELESVSSLPNLYVGANVLSPIVTDDSASSPSLIRKVDSGNMLLRRLVYDISMVDEAFSWLFAESDGDIEFTFDSNYTTATLQLPPQRNGTFVSSTEPHAMKLTNYLDGSYEAAGAWRCISCRSTGSGFRYQ